MFCLRHKKVGKCNSEKQKATSDRRIRQHCSLAWLPISTSATGIITILVTYTFAVVNKHMFPLLPYISDTGIEYPESSIFSLCLDLVASLLVLTAYVRYQLISQFHQKLPAEPRYQRIGRVNTFSLVIAVVAASGLMVLANFTEHENLIVHLMGAFFCFAFGVTYLCLHTWLSFKTSPELSRPWMCFLRLIFTSFAALTLTLVIIFGTALRWNANECNPQMNYRRTSALFEWLLVVTFDLFFLSFAHEFHKVKMSTKVRILTRESSVLHFSKLKTSTSFAEDKKKAEMLTIQHEVNDMCYHGNGIMHILSNESMCGKTAVPV